MELRKIVFFLAAALLFVSTVSSQSIEVDSLSQPDGINASWTGDGVNFLIDFDNDGVFETNITENYSKVFKPDDLSTNGGVTAKFKSKNVNETQIDISFEVQDSNYPSIDGAKFDGGKVDIKKGKRKSSFVNGSITSSNTDYRLDVSSESHYEHLILNYELLNSTGGVENEWSNVYSGSETQRIPVSGGVNQLSAEKIQQRITKDNLYENRTTEKLVLAHKPETSISGIGWKGLNHTSLGSVNYSELVKPELVSADMSTGRISNPSNYEFTAYNVTYPADSKKTVEVNFTQPVYNPLTDSPENFQFSYYSYIIGSVATFQTNTSSEWANGSFSGIEESNGDLQLKNYNYNIVDAEGDGNTDRLEAIVGDYDNDYPLRTGAEFCPTRNFTFSSLEIPIDTSVGSDYNPTVDIRIDTNGADTNTNEGVSIGTWYPNWVGSSTVTINTASYSVNTLDGCHELALETQSSDNDANSDDLVTLVDDNPSNTYTKITATAEQYSASPDITFTGKSDSGDYISAVYSASEEKIWDNITLSNFNKNGGSLDVWVKTSNDGFSTTLEEEKISNSTWSSSGTQTVDLSLSQGATDVKYNVSMSKGSSSPSIDSISLDGKTANKPPAINSSKYVDDRRNGYSRLVFGIDDKSESDITDFNGLGSAFEFTNTTLKSSISLPFISTVNVSDSKSAFSSNKQVDLSETDSDIREDEYSHSLNTQRVNRTVTIFNGASSSIDYELVLDLAGTVVQGQSWTGTIPTTDSVTHTAVTETDWVTGETESTLNKYSDVDYDHGEDQQRIHNRTQLVADNSRSFPFTGVNVSGSCSRTGSTDVPSGTGVTVTNDCNRPTFLVDTITESVTSLQEDSTELQNLSTQHGYKRKDLTENDGYSYSQVDISAPSLSGTCENCNVRARDIAASSSISEYYNSSSDWVTGETESTYTKYSDNNYNHTEDGQQIVNRTQLIADNSRSFTLHYVDISSTCSKTTTANISPATGFQATNDCNRPTFNVDVLTTSTGNLQEDTGKNHGLHTQYVKKNKTVSETGGYSWSGVDIFAPSIDGSCSDCSGTRTRDISSTGSVTGTYHASADWISGETENDFNEVGENPSASHTLDMQYNLWETELVVDNFQGFGFTSVDLSSYCENTASANIPSGTGVQITTNCSTVEQSGDFITGETEGTFDKYSDNDFDHTENGQRIHNRTKLLVDNSKQYSYSSVNLSSTCSETSTADIASGTGVEATTDCSRPVFNVDYITESVGSEFVDTSYSHGLDTQGLAVYKNISETGGYSFNQVNVSAPAFDGTCVNCGERTADISANGDNSFTYNSTGDWISGENRSTYSKYSDTGFNHTEEGQQIVNRTKLVVDNKRSAEFQDVDISSTCTETVSGSVLSGSGVQVTSDCTRNSFSGDWISTNISEEAGDSSYGHSLDSQGVFVVKNVSEVGGYSWSNVSVSTPSINGSCVNCGLKNVSLNAGESATEYYNASSDWITDVSEYVSKVGQDTSVEAGIDEQVLYNQSSLSVNNTRQFSFNSVDVSSRCSTTQSVDVAQGENVVTQACNNDSFSGDWIQNEDNTSTNYISGDVLLGEGATESFEAQQTAEVTNVRSNTDMEVNLDSLLESVPGCSLENSSTQNAAADSVSQFEFYKSCTPGEHLNRTPVTKTETSDFYKYSIEFGFQVNSNLTEEQDISYAVKREWADNWNNRDPTETEIFVNDRDQDVSISEEVINDTEYLVITVGNEYGNSSLHKGTHEASLSYYETKSPGSTSGTSGSTGGGVISDGEERLVENVSSDKYNYSVSIISTKDTQSYQISGYPGASFENFIVLRNTGDSNVTLDVECEDLGEVCDWVDVDVDRVVLDRNSFTEKVVTVSGEVPESFSDESAPASFSIKVSDPRSNDTGSNGVGVEYVDFTVTHDPFLGPALDTALKFLEWREVESPVPWGNPIPYWFPLLPGFLTVLFGGAWWAVELASPMKARPDARAVVSVTVFLLLFVLL